MMGGGERLLSRSVQPPICLSSARLPFGSYHQHALADLARSSHGASALRSRWSTSCAISGAVRSRFLVLPRGAIHRASVNIV